MATVIVTGIAGLDVMLATLEPKLQTKLARKSLRYIGKLVVAAAKAIVKAEAYDTGTLHNQFKVRALKRKAGRIGVSMFADRDSTIVDYWLAYGHPPHPAKGS